MTLPLIFRVPVRKQRSLGEDALKDPPPDKWRVCYLIPHKWWRQFQLHVNMKEVNFGEGENDDAPGPINTNSLLAHSNASQQKASGRGIGQQLVELKPGLHEGKNVFAAPPKLWALLHDWYGGGPAILRQFSNGRANLYPNQHKCSAQVGQPRKRRRALTPPPSLSKAPVRLDMKFEANPPSGATEASKPKPILPPQPSRDDAGTGSKLRAPSPKTPPLQSRSSNKRLKVGSFWKKSSQRVFKPQVQVFGDSSPAEKPTVAGIPNGVQALSNGATPGERCTDPPEKAYGPSEHHSSKGERNGTGHSSSNGSHHALNGKGPGARVFGPQLPPRFYGPDLPTSGRNPQKTLQFEPESKSVVYGPAPPPPSAAYSAEKDMDSHEFGDGWELYSGICGLSNLGNTCFMNTALQCLAHTQQLRDFFLSPNFHRHLRPGNPLGSKGEVAMAFSRLLKSMGREAAASSSGMGPKVVPREFRHVIARFQPRFAGYHQHDCHEFLAYLLDGLHEDVNEASCKSKANGNGHVTAAKASSDDDAGKAWSQHLKRNQSRIVDLFHGLFRSSICCSNCKYKSVTYDPFCYLSLPVPSSPQVRNGVPSSTGRSLRVTYYPIDSMKQPRKIFIPIPYNAGVVTGHYLSQAVSREVRIPPRRITVAKTGKFRYVIIRNKQETAIENLASCVAYELPPPPKDSYYHGGAHPHRDWVGHYATGFVSCRQRVNSGRMKWTRPVAIPVIVPISRNTSYGTLRRYVGKYLERVLAHAPTLQTIVRRNDYNLFRLFTPPEKGDMRKMEPDDISQAKEMHFVHNSRSKSQSFAVDLKYRNDLREIVDFSNGNRDSDARHAGNNNSHSGSGVPYSNRPGSVNLGDCFQLFTKPEILSDVNAWKCSKCKMQCKATKRLAIARLPDVLVIHLKRFRFTDSRGGKVDTLVRFPVSDLDLSKYLHLNGKSVAHDTTDCANFNSTRGKKPNYELYAVSNHFGSLEFGHYTAFAKTKDDAWYHFDDTSTSKVVSEGSLVSRASYILFYKRKQAACASTFSNAKTEMKQRERKEKRKLKNGHTIQKNGDKVYRSYQWNVRH